MEKPHYISPPKYIYLNINSTLTREPNMFYFTKVTIILSFEISLLHICFWHHSGLKLGTIIKYRPSDICTIRFSTAG